MIQELRRLFQDHYGRACDLTDAQLQKLLDDWSTPPDPDPGDYTRAMLAYEQQVVAVDHWRAYKLWLEDAERSPEERAKRWEAFAPPIPLSRWRAIVDEHLYSTWDVAVECFLDAKERKVVIGLGYYGQKVKKVHASWIHRGHCFEHKQKGKFLLRLSGPEPSSEKEFTKLDAVEKYVRDRIQWCSNRDGASFNTDYVTYDLVGFTLQDIGIDPADWRP